MNKLILNIVEESSGSKPPQVELNAKFIEKDIERSYDE
jgi:hypothetical protein